MRDGCGPSFLERLTGGDADAFLAASYGRRPHAFPGKPGAFADLFGWSALNDVLATHRLGPPRLRLSLDGRQAAPSSYLLARRDPQGAAFTQVDPAGLSAALSEGATLVLDAVNELYAPVRDAATSLGAVFGDEVGVNAYLGWSDRPGFGVHRDGHDVIVVQVAGEKAWTVFEGKSGCDAADAAEPPTEVFWSSVLRDGSALYIPRGWWHEARMTGAPSIHLTFSIQNPTGLDYFGWLQTRLSTVPAVAADLPQFAPGPARAEHARRLREALMAALSAEENDVDAFLAHRRRAWRPPARMALPFSLGIGEAIDDTLRIRLAVPLPLDLSRRADGSGTLNARGKTWSLTAEALSVLSVLSDGRARSVGALRAAAGNLMPAPLLAPLTAFLLAQEILSVAPDAIA